MRREIIDNDFFSASLESRTGGRTENQDSCNGRGLSEQGDKLLLSVCDGMGGAAGGSFASRMAIETIFDVVAQNMTVVNTDNDEAILRVLEKAVRKANAAVWQRSCDEPLLRGMGTTTVTLLLTPRAAYVAHVGDSRLYQLRDGNKVFRTWDHSRVFELVEMGHYTEEEARTATASNIITRAVGVKSSVEVDTRRLEYNQGDRFVLCSDGIWGTMPEDQLIKLLSSERNNRRASAKVAQDVDDMGIQSKEEYDNLTVVMADVKQDSKYRMTFVDMFRSKFSRLTKNIKKSK